MSVTLVRHTQTEWSSDTCYGNLDINLRTTYPQDIETVVNAVTGNQRVYTSPLKRCRLLANAIAERFNSHLMIEPDLIEMNFGTWQGKSWDEVPRSELDEWAADFERAKPHEGESIMELRQRVLGFYQSIKDQEGVLLVTHAGVIRTILASLNNQDERNITIDYGESFTIPRMSKDINNDD